MNGPINIKKIINSGKAYYDLYEDGTLDITIYKGFSDENVTDDNISSVTIREYPYKKEDGCERLPL